MAVKKELSKVCLGGGVGGSWESKVCTRPLDYLWCSLSTGQQSVHGCQEGTRQGVLGGGVEARRFCSVTAQSFTKCLLVPDGLDRKQ